MEVRWLTLANWGKLRTLLVCIFRIIVLLLFPNIRGLKGHELYTDRPVWMGTPWNTRTGQCQHLHQNDKTHISCNTSYCRNIPSLSPCDGKRLLQPSVAIQRHDECKATMKESSVHLFKWLRPIVIQLLCYMSGGTQILPQPLFFCLSLLLHCQLYFS